MGTRIYPMSFEFKEIAVSLQQAILGYGFRPTEEELINYLKSEFPGWRASFCIIPTLENIESIYKVNPWDLPAKFNDKSIIPSIDQEWWFICPKTQNPRIGRKTPCGFSWKITGRPVDIKAGYDEKKIGSKIRLVFPDVGQTNWVIHEYHLLDNELNRDYVLCHLKHRRDEKDDNSTIESEHGANYYAELDQLLYQPDHEGSFSEPSIQAMMRSLIQNNQSPTVMDTDEYVQLVSETSEEDEDADYMIYRDLLDDGFIHGDQMQTQHECPALMENRRTRTVDSLHGVVPLDEKKGKVENKVSGSLFAPEKPIPPPARTASAKYYGKDEVLRFEKVKQEDAAKSILDETTARAKNGQIFMMENRQTGTIGSLHGFVPLEQKKSVIQSKFNSSHVSSTKRMVLPKEPKTPKMPELARIYINGEPRLKKVMKQESALRNVKTECASLDEAAATAQVLKYQEHCSASNSLRKTETRKIEQAREKPNSVIALIRPTTKSTKSSTDPSLPNLVNVLVGFFLLCAITCQVLKL